MTMFRFLLAKHGPLGYGLFMAGATSGATPTDTSEKYSFSSEAVSSGATLARNARNCAAIGNFEKALLAVGFTGTGTGSHSDRLVNYIHATNTSSDSSTMSISRAWPTAIFTQSAGHFVGGTPITTNQTNINDKFVFSTEVRSSAATLSTARTITGEVSGSSYGVIAGAWIDFTTTLDTTEKYNFSTNAMSASTTLSAAARYSRGASTIEHGVLIGGADSSGTKLSSTTKFIFSNESISGGGTLGTAFYTHCASSCREFAVVAYDSLTLKTTQKYMFSTASASTGTSTALSRTEGAGASSTPGHL